MFKIIKVLEDKSRNNDHINYLSVLLLISCILHLVSLVLP